MSRFNPKWIIGRTIVACEMNPFDSGDGHMSVAHNPVITLDNGARLKFMAEEAADGYGIDIVYFAASQRRKHGA